MAKILNHAQDPKFIRLGEKLEALREKHEQGLVTSIEFLKLLLELAKEAARAEKDVVPEQEIDKGIAALTELFNGVRNKNTPVIVERIGKETLVRHQVKVLGAVVVPLKSGAHNISNDCADHSSTCLPSIIDP